MKSALSNLVLVLNKSWIPVRIETVRMSIDRIFSGRAMIVEETDYAVYDWASWVDKFSISRDEEWTSSKPFVTSVRLQIRIPEVIVLQTYNKVPRLSVRLTRKNLMIRDNFKCQYSGEKIRRIDATMDHVMPKSRGGKTVWENVVICSKAMNSRKGSRTPQEAGLKLLNQPKKPHWDPIYTTGGIHQQRPEFWQKFLK